MLNNVTGEGPAFFFFGEERESMKETVKKWLDSEFVSDEDKAIIKGLSDNDLTEAFHKNVEFGTAGMRGLMGVGTKSGFSLCNVYKWKRCK